MGVVESGRDADRLQPQCLHFFEHGLIHFLSDAFFAAVRIDRVVADLADQVMRIIRVKSDESDDPAAAFADQDILRNRRRGMFDLPALGDGIALGVGQIGERVAEAGPGHFLDRFPRAVRNVHDNRQIFLTESPHTHFTPPSCLNTSTASMTPAAILSKSIVSSVSQAV